MKLIINKSFLATALNNGAVALAELPARAGKLSERACAEWGCTCGDRSALPEGVVVEWQGSRRALKKLLGKEAQVRSAKGALCGN